MPPIPRAGVRPGARRPGPARSTPGEPRRVAPLVPRRLHVVHERRHGAFQLTTAARGRSFLHARGLLHDSCTRTCPSPEVTAFSALPSGTNPERRHGQP
jgi:hypothetical protein